MTDASPPLPANIEAEQALLGAILLNNDAYHRVSAVVEPGHFSEPAHRDLFEAISNLIGEGRTASPVTLASWFTGEIVAGTSWQHYLARLVAGSPTIINAPDYARAVRDAADNRALIALGAELDRAARAPGADPKSLIEVTETALFALAETGQAGRVVTGFDAAMRDALEMAAAAYKRDGGLSGMSTGLIDLDRQMGGLQRSDLVVLAARPGMGKTSLATNLAYHAANNFVGETGPDGKIAPVKGGRVLFFSLEMSAEQLATRILSEQARVPSSDIRRGMIDERQFEALTETSRRLHRIPLHIDDNGGVSIAHVANTARRVLRQRGVDLIVVDYLQLLTGANPKNASNRTQEITEISGNLKALAKELDVPVLALSQLSRQVESRADKRPLLADLRDSGSIEQDADVVLFLYREDYYLKMAEPAQGTAEHLDWQAKMEAAHGKAECIVAKQRHGPTGTIELQFDEAFTRFGNIARKSFLAERAGR